MLSILDNRIEALPACDKIVHNSSDVSYPYFRADSFMGSLYIQDTGLYNVQIISEKIIPENLISNRSNMDEIIPDSFCLFNSGCCYPLILMPYTN